MGASEKCSEKGSEDSSEKTVGKGATLQKMPQKTLQKRPLETPLKIAEKLGIRQLTPARAMIAELIRRYLVLGIDCSLLEVQKLAWFLERNVIRFGLLFGDRLAPSQGVRSLHQVTPGVKMLVATRHSLLRFC